VFSLFLPFKNVPFKGRTQLRVFEKRCEGDLIVRKEEEAEL